MNLNRIFLAGIAILLTLACLPVVTAAQTIGGNEGWITVNCNVDGANVYFDGTYKGQITSGVLTVAVYSTGTPYKTYSVSKTGYTTYSGSIPSMPAMGQTITLYATLNPVAPTTAAPIGGNQGYFVVHCNVNGATVMFGNDVKGVITDGTLTVPVYTTGTPYKTYSVSKNGYTPYSADVPAMPGAGKTINLYATLNPVVPTTAAVIGGGQGWYAVNCNVNGATVSFNNQVVGVITQGTLTVPVYTTGTPYTTYTVSMNGYLPYTASLTSVPAPGQTITLYATLNPAPTPAPTKSPLPVFLIPLGLGIAGILCVRKYRS